MAIIIILAILLLQSGLIISFIVVITILDFTINQRKPGITISVILVNHDNVGNYNWLMT